MSLNTYDSSSGTLTTIASANRIWTGTKAEWQALVQAGTAPRNVLVAITDDEEHASADEISYDNTTSGLTAQDVQNAIDEIATASPTTETETTGIMTVSSSYGTLGQAVIYRYGNVRTLNFRVNITTQVPFNTAFAFISKSKDNPVTSYQTIYPLNAATAAVGNGCYLNSNNIHATANLPVGNWLFSVTYLVS